MMQPKPLQKRNLRFHHSKDEVYCIALVNVKLCPRIARIAESRRIVAEDVTGPLHRYARERRNNDVKIGLMCNVGGTIAVTVA
jgi:hypothetical protein